MDLWAGEEKRIYRFASLPLQPREATLKEVDVAEQVMCIPPEPYQNVTIK